MPPGSNRTTKPREEPETTEFPGSPIGLKQDLDSETLFILRQYLRPDQLDQPKLLQFILKYLECRNASQAAKEAGAPGKGSSWRSRPEIHAAIEALTAKMVMKYGYDGAEVIERVKEISNFDPVVFENPDGSYKTHLSLIDPESRRAIKKFKVKNLYGEDANGMRIVMGQIIEIEVWDKLKAHELLGREKSVMKETKVVTHDVTNNMKDVLLESRSRALARSREVIEIEGKVETDTVIKSGE